MSIHWPTFFAQVVNFLILVWLLKRFLYGPVVRAMDEREKRIAARLEEAAQRQAEAEREAATLKRQREELEKARETLLAEARQEADELRRRLTTQAREEIERLKQQWREAITRRQAEFLSELRERMARELLQVTREALNELADVKLEHRIVDVFLARWQQADGELVERLTDLLERAGDGLEVLSAFELSAEDQERLETWIRERLGYDGEVTFHTNSELIAGIQLRAAGHKVAFSLGDFVETLEERMAAELEAAQKVVA